MDPIGSQRHLVTPQNPGTPISDGDGGFTVTWAAVTPATWYVSIAPATVRDLERISAQGAQSSATHIVKGRYHPGVMISTRLTKGPRQADGTLAAGSREFAVTGVFNVDERRIETIAMCTERLP